MPKKIIAKVMMLCEMEVSSAENADQEIQAALDKFREAAQPATEHGLTFYRLTAKNLFLLTNATGATTNGPFIAPFVTQQRRKP